MTESGPKDDQSEDLNTQPNQNLAEEAQSPNTP
jgi:hypothetical protein